MIRYSILKTAQLPGWNWCSNTCEYLAEKYKWLFYKTIELGTVMFLFYIFPEVPCNFFVSNNCFCCHQFSSVQSLSCVRLFMTPWTAACQPSLSITNSQSLLKLMSIESVMPSNHLILCHPLLLQPSTFPSIRVFSNESALHIR